MAISTTTQKLAVIEWDVLWEPGLPISPGTLGQDDKQQLLWGYPGVLWATAAGVDNAKLAHMEWCLVWEPGLPTNPGALGQDDKQQLLWGYPSITWPALVVEEKRTHSNMAVKFRRMRGFWHNRRK